jgi:hypothetical protein
VTILEDRFEIFLGMDYQVEEQKDKLCKNFAITSYHISSLELEQSLLSS